MAIFRRVRYELSGWTVPPWWLAASPLYRHVNVVTINFDLWVEVIAPLSERWVCHLCLLSLTQWILQCASSAWPLTPSSMFISIDDISAITVDLCPCQGCQIGHRFVPFAANLTSLIDELFCINVASFLFDICLINNVQLFTLIYEFSISISG